MVNGEQLVLVEDDAATREILALLLRAQGWAVTVVDCGEVALAAIADGVAPEVVLCDLHLPGMDGPLLLEQLRGVLPANVAVMAMTASLREGSGNGYDAVVVKPFAAEAIEAAWMAGRATQAAADEGDAVLDLRTVDRLRASMGEHGMRGLYAFALADAGDRMDRMENAITQDDNAAFVQEAHALKGSCGMIGAQAVWRLAGNAEMEGFTTAGREKVTQLRIAIEAVRLMLEALFPV